MRQYRQCVWLLTTITLAWITPGKSDGSTDTPKQKIAKIRSDYDEDEVLLTSPEGIATNLKQWKVIPDLLEEAPELPMQAEWVEGPEALFGNEINQTVVKREPYWVCWKNNSTDYYTMILTGIDEKAKKHTFHKENQFWVVTNMKECDVVSGDCLTEYLGPTPSVGKGLHRYVFLIYKQPEKMEFKEPKITAEEDTSHRTNFSSKLFAEKYNLGKPIAVNFFQAKFFSPAIIHLN